MLAQIDDGDHGPEVVALLRLSVRPPPAFVMRRGSSCSGLPHFFDASLVPLLPPDVDFDEDELLPLPLPLLLFLALSVYFLLKASWRTMAGVPLLLFPEVLRGFMIAIFCVVDV
ncbi:hypothetical protein F5X68DRAFT_213890 [Plectosphaerella plurivora]|uniref:Uncharacterized protein n=1 Tax=Plectosphaerella plurivora TaxID=936078 RepID=A0A9P9A8X6_9PEZI|nr:hypothetical protein F5X68DRAFT_213890 [Plectosphaerella plurivora]